MVVVVVPHAPDRDVVAYLLLHTSIVGVFPCDEFIYIYISCTLAAHVSDDLTISIYC
jgi:hypothetical protein